MGEQAETAAKGQKEDHLAGEEQVEKGQVQVASRETLGVEKKVFPAKSAVAEEEVFGKGSVAEEVSGEIGGEKEIAFKDQVGLRKEGEKDVLQEECVIFVVGLFLEGERGIVIIVKLFQGEGSLPDARDR